MELRKGVVYRVEKKPNAGRVYEDHNYAKYFPEGGRRSAGVAAIEYYKDEECLEYKGFDYANDYNRNVTLHELVGTCSKGADTCKGLWEV